MGGGKGREGREEGKKGKLDGGIEKCFEVKKVGVG